MIYPKSCLDDALSGLRDMLLADDYRLEVWEEPPGSLTATIGSGPQACPTCLIPKSMMLTYLRKALERLPAPAQITLLYPDDPVPDHGGRP